MAELAPHRCLVDLRGTESHYDAFHLAQDLKSEAVLHRRYARQLPTGGANGENKKDACLAFSVFFGPVHLIFLLFLTGAKAPALGMGDIGFAVCIMAFAVNHVFSYFHHRQEDMNGTPNVAAFWVCPGLRLFPMFLALKTVLPVSGSGISLLQFLILQTTVDIIMHMGQHSDMRAKT